MTEKYPVLAVPDAKVKWEYFNSKLSLALRNMRCQVKKNSILQDTVRRHVMRRQL